MIRRLALLPALPLVLACAGGREPLAPCCPATSGALRIVNGFPQPIDVLLDGVVVIDDLGAGAIGFASPPPRTHSLSLRSGAATSAAQGVTTASGATRTLAAVRTAGGSIAATTLDDTNSVVPAGATKVRVLHLAPAAGVLQVHRTQPDFATPISWQFPFTYQADPTSLTAPFYQSTVGTWEIRVWQSPADASGWATAPVRVSIPLGSGEKKTVVILDAPGGGVRVELL